ncbi:DUF4373 domain-containing protein [Parabacteroides sp. AM08-6]|uniref:DUF4373 domain-containing protein n=1 Tax=Parabacteroides sp. AM08-6 TaxID=2292053 RepID=UPI000EFF6272|nr:DUF4373 domain-containing protein [Parabacteroides sp. AM08-6]RHJ81888.1 DUF4373 domain-containing protein [Parabacteroides sp. AM08-6]
MARPIKKGLDYFPFDTNFFSNIRVLRLMNCYGAEGINTYIALLCDIYRGDGYFLKISDDYFFILSKQIEIKEEVIKMIIQKCVELGLFDENLYQTLGILTSKSVQKRYLAVTKRSANPIIPEFNCINGENIGVIASKTPVSATEMRQTKENKTKEKETKQNSLTSFIPVCVRGKWPEWKDELLGDEDWRAAATRQSGGGLEFNNCLPSLLDEFCDYLVSSSEEDSVETKKDFARRFHYWWQYHKIKKISARAEPSTKLSRIEEINRVGDASLEIARKLLKCA